MTNLQNLLAQKAELEKALNEVNELIKAEQDKAEQAPKVETITIENTRLTIKTEEKETAKGTQYIYTLNINGNEITRKSKKQYTHVILVEHEGRIILEGFSSSEKTAHSLSNSWKKVGGKGKVFSI